MGCFGGKKQPVYKPPPPPKLPTAEELFAGGEKFARSTQPLAFGAREGALSDIATPQATNQFFTGFQPSSFDEALGNQYFQNVYPDVERTIKHGLSLSGIESSPILAQQLGRARGQVGFDIGSYLSNIANQRAMFNLQSRLGIDPNQIVAPFVNTGLSQSQRQAGLDYDFAQQQAQAEYQQALQDYQQRQGLISSIGTIAGGGLGFLVGGPYGASIGSSLGGSAASLFGGGEAPVDFGSALQFANNFDPGFGGRIGQGYGRNTPRGTINTGSMSRLPNATTTFPVFFNN
jgi:hypothetical protein